MSRPLRVAIIADFLEERWPSMDLIAETIFEQLKSRFKNAIQPALIRPLLRKRLSRLGSQSRKLLNADRAIGRFLDYPNLLRSLHSDFDLFHIIDHSYAHLVCYLPAGKTIVTCHDLDAFRCILTPSADPRPELFRAMTRRILRGLQSASRIICVSNTTREEVLRFALIPSERLTVIYNGVAPAFGTTRNQGAEAVAAQLLGPADPERIELLHVGSTIPRKRIDILLRTFARVRERWSNCRLIQVGGELTHEQMLLASKLGVREVITVTPPLDREVVSAIYRRAALVMIPSDAEGFGLPMIEAMTCGTPVLASRIGALMEVGGAVAEYAPVANVDAWVKLANQLLAQRLGDPVGWAARQKAGVKHAAEFSWDSSVRKLVDLYHNVAGATDESSAHR